MSKPIDLYHASPCPFSRQGWIVGKITGLPINTIFIDLMEGDERKPPAFLKLNPTKTVPTINDNGFSLYESKAVALYFIEKSRNYSLYPQDIQKRGIIHRMLFWEATSFSPAVGGYVMPTAFGATRSDAELEKARSKMEEKMAELERFLSKSKFVTGDEMSLADVGIFTNLTMLQLLNHDYGAKTPKIKQFMERMLENPVVREAQEKAEIWWQNAKDVGFFKVGVIKKFI